MGMTDVTLRLGETVSRSPEVMLHVPEVTSQLKADTTLLEKRTLELSFVDLRKKNQTVKF